MSDTLCIKIDDKYWDGAADAKIQQSVESMSGAFSFLFPQFMQSDIVKSLKNGQTAEVLINDKTVIKGYVDTIRFKERASEKYLLVSGRDSTGDLVDCTFAGTPNEWKKQTALKIISDLCAMFSIDAVAKGTASSSAQSILESFKATEGVTICSLIAQICVDNSIMPVSLGDGKLTLIRAEDAELVSTQIKNPGSIIEMSFNASDCDRFSKYITKGQGVETSEKGLTAFLQAFGSFDDSIVTRYRSKTLFPENPTTAAQCISRSKWEAKYQAGKSRQLSYIVPGFTMADDGNKPWSINSLISVDDATLGLSKVMYCSDILFSRDGSRDTTLINLVQQSTFTEGGKTEKMVVD